MDLPKLKTRKVLALDSLPVDGIDQYDESPVPRPKKRKLDINVGGKEL